MVKKKSPQKKSAAEAAYKGAFGFKPSEKIEKLVAKLHFSFKQTVEQIAETTDISVEEIQQITQAYQAKNQ
jgi:DNA-directed RNA polymerase specialized sigma subunit